MARTGGNLRSPEELHRAIAVVAYYMAEGRNFEPGHQTQDVPRPKSWQRWKV